jgi:type I restriction enzyme M protein
MRQAVRSSRTNDPLETEPRATALRIMRLRGHVAISEFKQFIFGLLLLKALSERSDTPFRVLWADLFRSKDAEQTAAILDSMQQAWIDANPAIAGVLPRALSSIEMESSNLRELISTLDAINVSAEALDAVFSESLEQIAASESRTVCDYFTPRYIQNLILRVAGPESGTIYDPCCGTGGLLLAAYRAARAAGNSAQLIGHESNATTWNLARSRFAINAVSARIGDRATDSFRERPHANARADLVVGNPPFNQSEWGAPEQTPDRSWPYGVPPAKNANFAWIQHALLQLEETGTAVLLMSSGTLSSTFRGEDQIRRRLVDADVVDCIVSLPKYQANAARVYACLWILTWNKQASSDMRPRRQRRGEVLMIASQGADDAPAELHDLGVDRIAQAYHSWRGSSKLKYKDEPGYCRKVTLSQIAQQNYILMPSRFVSPIEPQNNEKDSRLQLQRSITALNEQFSESARLEREIRETLQRMGMLAAYD